MYLSAQFREKGAYPLIAAPANLPGEDFTDATCDIHPGELIPEIETAYEQGLVDPRSVSVDNVRTEERRSRAELMRELEHNRFNKYIDDAAEAMSWRSFEAEDDEYYDPDFLLLEGETYGPIIREEIIGRNQPCPCSNGKKCCGM